MTAYLLRTIGLAVRSVLAAYSQLTSTIPHKRDLYSVDLFSVDVCSTERETQYMTEKYVKQVVLDLGATVRELRIQLGYSQEGFADHVGLDRTYISGIERGVLNPSVKNLVKVAQGLSVPVCVLFGCTGECHRR